jgi:Flp pilus assembly pilin Flp
MGLNSSERMRMTKLLPARIYLAALALRDREEGQALVEYALILSLVVIAAVVVLQAFGTKVSVLYQSVNDGL